MLRNDTNNLIDRILFYISLIVVIIIPIEGYAIVEGLSFNGIAFPLLVFIAFLKPTYLIPKSKTYLLILVSFTLLCFISTLWSSYKEETLYRSFILFQNLLLVIIIENVFDTKKKFKFLIIAYIIGSVICALGMIYDVYFIGFYEVDAKEVYRSLLFGNTNENSFLINYSVVLVYVIYKDLNIFKNWGVAILNIFFAFSLIISGSRTGVLMFVFILIFVILFSINKNKLLYLLILFIVLIYTSSLLFSIIPKNYIDRILGIENALVTKQLSQREIIWENAISMIDESDFSLLLGKGWGTFKLEYKKRNGIEYAAHNFYISIFYTTGLLGSTIFIMYIITLLKKIFKLKQDNPVYFLLLIIPLISMMTTNWDTRKWWFFMGVLIFKFYEFRKIKLIND